MVRLAHKEYIKDNGKVRLCSSNIARMNLLECLWYNKARIPMIYIEALGMIYLGAFAIATILVSPIHIPIQAYMMIRDAKREVKRSK